jgi:hypothetical protein
LGNWRFLGLLGISELRPLRHADEVGKAAKAISRMDAVRSVARVIAPFEGFSSPRIFAGWQVHHLVEKRFWRQLGFSSFKEGKAKILSAIIPRDIHLSEITPQLRRLIPNSKTGTATLQQIWNAHKKVYSQYEWGKDWLDTIWNEYFKGKGVKK